MDADTQPNPDSDRHAHTVADSKHHSHAKPYADA
jgi:hypothetical protein